MADEIVIVQRQVLYTRDEPDRHIWTVGWEAEDELTPVGGKSMRGDEEWTVAEHYATRVLRIPRRT